MGEFFYRVCLASAPPLEKNHGKSCVEKLSQPVGYKRFSFGGFFGGYKTQNANLSNEFNG